MSRGAQHVAEFVRALVTRVRPFFVLGRGELRGLVLFEGDHFGVSVSVGVADMNESRFANPGLSNMSFGQFKYSQMDREKFADRTAAPIPQIRR
ncbi:hypothetical protein NN3_21660 [Nocardia neocaledoniensis NBRC 108232]|nr:hypothetical protein NN3_21660 [Nocardia neocaledoniensis NBRC 108232]